jgi:hypothetical protein
MAADHAGMLISMEEPTMEKKACDVKNPIKSHDYGIIRKELQRRPAEKLSPRLASGDQDRHRGVNRHRTPSARLAFYGGHVVILNQGKSGDCEEAVVLRVFPEIFRASAAR